MYHLYTVVYGNPGKRVSSHRSLEAAIKADNRLQKEHRRYYGGNGFTPTTIIKDGAEVDSEERNECALELQFKQAIRR